MAEHGLVSSPAERRAHANASGLAGRVLDILREYPDVQPWEYSAALDPETDPLLEPQRTEIRKIWFEHLESRDTGRSSSFLSNSNVGIIPTQGLILEVFIVALKQAPEAARELLRRNRARLSPSTVSRAADDGTTLHLAARCNCASVLADLLKIIKQYSVTDRKSVIETKDNAGRTVLIIAIQELNLEGVKILIQEQPTLLDMTWGPTTETPLHTAISLAAKQDPRTNRIPEIVEAIVECRKATLWARNGEGDPPYYCARQLEGKGSQVCKTITQMLKQYIIRDLRRDVRMARDAIYGKSEQNKELGLNLSDFNQPSHDFTEFISAIWNHGPAVKDLKFEQTLFYVVLPDFYHRDTDHFHTEVEILFKWLVAQDVTSIIELVIPDSLEHPLGDDFVQANILDKFSVTRLDWRKLDVNVNILTESAKSKDSLQTVHLYSSGNWSVLYHWTSSDGLCKLEKLKKEGRVLVKIVERKLPSSQTPLYPLRLRQYQDRAKELFEASGLKHSVNIGDIDVAVVSIHGEDPAHYSNLGFSADYKDCHEVISAIKSEVPQLANLLTQHVVKVAIVDNGADKVRPTFSNNIKEGISFVTTGGGKYELPYWHCTDPHGAQMASIICGINPDCHLYIARVGSSRNDVNLDSAAMAIDWAIARHVDIISISWTTKTDHPTLREAIGRATSEDILIVASTADEGELAHEQVYPARYPSVVTVSALDKFNKRRGQSQKAVDILIRGEDLSVIGPTYIKDKSLEAISGSSVATAVTAGIASLMLVLVRIVNLKQELWVHFRRPEEMKKLFELMHTSKNHHDPALLFRDLFKKGKRVWGPHFKHPAEKWSEDLVPTGNIPAGQTPREPELLGETISAQVEHQGDYLSSRSTTWASAVSQLSVR
ncbi:hypothetical protein MMC18_007206 [Xylographa bjoerkii]|nr:hypothetical protein [Xylographa bjoerkii]